MNDFDQATRQIGNRFDLVLVASERMRELHAKRRQAEQQGELTLQQRRHQPVPAHRAIQDIEQGIVGREYLNRIQPRTRRKPKYDEI